MNHKYLNKISAVFLRTHLKTSRRAIFYGLISGLLLACPDSPATPTVVNNCVDIINAGIIPSDFAGYDQASREIFSNYPAGAKVVVKYVVPNGSGDGSSTNNAAGNLKTVLDGITDATDDKIYAVFVAPGTYDAGVAEVMAMKNNVAIVGGATCSGIGAEAPTILSGNKTHQVFFNTDLNHTALLYGVTIANGSASFGAGMNNKNSSPTLIRINFFSNTATFGGGMYNQFSSRPVLTGVTFSGNTATTSGGGINNNNSSPVLTKVAFSRNRATTSGGGMYNTASSPVLTEATFSENTATANGGGMYNEKSSRPVLTRGSFISNTAQQNGGGMYNTASSPVLNSITFSNNWVKGNGAGMYNTTSSPLLTGGSFSKNWAVGYGGGMYNIASAPVLSSVTFSWNRSIIGGGGMGNLNSSPVLIGVTIFRNGSAGGGGVYSRNEQYGNGINPPTGVRLVNTIMWSNVVDGTTIGKEIYLSRGGLSLLRLHLYNSVLEGGIPAGYGSGGAAASLSGVGIRATTDYGGDSTRVFFANIITDYPDLDNTFADNGGGVFTHAIPTPGSAVDAGLYVRRSVASTRGCPDRNGANHCDTYTYYYSADNSKWYLNPTLTTTATLPADAVDLTATDATGHERTGRPDIGAYEAR